MSQPYESDIGYLRNPLVIISIAPLLGAFAVWLGAHNPAAKAAQYIGRVLLALMQDQSFPPVPIFSRGLVVERRVEIAAAVTYLRHAGAGLATMDIDDRISITLFYGAELLQAIAEGAEHLPEVPASIQPKHERRAGK